MVYNAPCDLKVKIKTIQINYHFINYADTNTNVTMRNHESINFPVYLAHTIHKNEA